MNYYSRQDFLSLNMSTAFHQDAQGRDLNGEEVSRTSLVGGVEGDGAAVIVVHCPLGPCLEGQ